MIHYIHITAQKDHCIIRRLIVISAYCVTRVTLVKSTGVSGTASLLNKRTKREAIQYLKSIISFYSPEDELIYIRPAAFPTVHH